MTRIVIASSEMTPDDYPNWDESEAVFGFDHQFFISEMMDMYRDDEYMMDLLWKMKGYLFLKESPKDG